MFSTASPQFVEPSELSQKLGEGSVIENAEKSQSVVLSKMALEPLPPNDQRDGKVVGFFDQGLITGAAVLLVPAVSGLTVAS